MSDKKRIGIMGGTFDPIHYGHLIIAENACEQFSLDEVIFIPTGKTPHKGFSGQIMTGHRCEMVRLAIKNNRYFSMSLCEAENPNTSYTYQTLMNIQEEHPGDALYFILGADSLFSFERWRYPEMICRMATILVAVRDDLTEKKVDAMIESLTKRYRGAFYRLETPNFNVSSEKIRQRLEHGQTVRYLLPEEVWHYIRTNDLYRKNPAQKEPMSFGKINQILNMALDQDRYFHTLGVTETAVGLASIHGCDTVKARYAGFLHDCAKCIDNRKKIRMCQKFGVEISDTEIRNPTLLHAKCGAILAHEVYGINDPDILHAIQVHTTGCPNMSLLDKIIYIADYIEPGRTHKPHLKELRKLAKKDLDETLYLILKDTTAYLMKANKVIDWATMETYQYYKKKRGADNQ